MNSVMTILTTLALAVPLATLSGDNSTVIKSGDLQAQLAQLAPKAQTAGSSGSTLNSTGNLTLKLSVRTKSGGGEIHAHFDDLMIVQQGSAQLVTGGTVVDAQTSSEGETTGTGIKGGTSRAVNAGDVIIIPAGTPHQLLIAPGTVYSALVAKVKE